MNEKNSTRLDQAETVEITRNLSTELARSFVTICDAGSFRQAAARLSRSPSAVSLQVAKLEERLNCVLLNRNSRRIVLTEQGEVLLVFARRLLAVSDEAMAHFQGSVQVGELRLAAPHDLGVSLVPTLLRRFAETHPRIRVDVRLESSTTIQTLYANGEVNVALFSEGNSPRVPAIKIYSEDLCWLAFRGGKASFQDPLPLAVAEVGCSWREEALRALDESARAWRIAYSSDTSMGQIAAVRADLAIAALPATHTDRDIGIVSQESNLPPLGQVHLYLAEDGTDAAKAFAVHVISRNKLPNRLHHGSEFS